MDNFEYKLMYQHLTAVRDCVTNFTGYVMGGSGVLVTILAVSGDPFIAGVVALTASILVTMVALVILYKCNSHNRISGYLKVIEHEEVSGGGSIDQTILWEICIGRLHHYSRKRGTWGQVGASLRKLSIVPNTDHQQLFKVVQYMLRKNSPIDFRRRLKGVGIVLNAMTGSVSTESWVYPAYIATIHLVIVLLLVSGGAFLLMTSPSSASPFSQYLIPMIVTVSVVQAIAWVMYAGKLHDLIEGSSSVDSFFWRFLVVRNHVLRELGYTVNYPLAANWLTRTSEMIDRRVQLVRVESPFYTQLE